MDVVNRALAGDEAALTELADRLTPIVQARVARAVFKGGSPPDANVHEVVEDLVQEVFLALFDHGGKALRDWDPERGLSLENFVGLIAERRVASILRSARRNPWTESPTATTELDSTSRDAEPERRIAAREELRLLLDSFRDALSPLGWHVFELLFLRELSVEDVGRETGLSADAVYAWRSRLRRLARRLAHETI